VSFTLMLEANAELICTPHVPTPLALVRPCTMAKRGFPRRGWRSCDAHTGGSRRDSVSPRGPFRRVGSHDWVERSSRRPRGDEPNSRCHVLCKGSELVAVESGAAAIALQRGQGQIMRAHEVDETIIAAPSDLFAQTEPDSDVEPADPEPDLVAVAPKATGVTVVEATPVPALVGTVVGLTGRDKGILVPGTARVLQGVGDVPAVLSVLQFTTDGLSTATPLPSLPPP